MIDDAVKITTVFSFFVFFIHFSRFCWFLEIFEILVIKRRRKQNVTLNDKKPPIRAWKRYQIVLYVIYNIFFVSSFWQNTKIFFLTEIWISSQLHDFIWGHQIEDIFACSIEFDNLASWNWIHLSKLTSGDAIRFDWWSLNSGSSLVALLKWRNSSSDINVKSTPIMAFFRARIVQLILNVFIFGRPGSKARVPAYCTPAHLPAFVVTRKSHCSLSDDSKDHHCWTFEQLHCIDCIELILLKIEGSMSMKNLELVGFLFSTKCSLVQYMGCPRLTH